MIRAPSPTSPPFLPAGTLPPTPPPASPLDDIYASSPTSKHDPDELLSDLPSRQRNLDTDAYREGLSAAKGKYVQEGFDEGYTLGAEIGILAGWVLGVLQGLAGAVRSEEVEGLLESARGELVIERVLGREWVDEEGVWRWDAEGEGDGEDVTFREVAKKHPIVKAWIGRVKGLSEKFGVDLEAMENRSGEAEQS